MGRNFHELEVYQNAYAFVLECYPTIESILSTADPDMARQLRRALTSILVNIAEGCGSRSQKVFLNHLSYSYGSAREVEVLISLAKDFLYFDSQVALALLAQLDDVKKMLYGFMRRIEESIDSGRNKWRYNYSRIQSSDAR